MAKETSTLSVPHIILGLLKEPTSGYSIKQDFDNVFKNFWAAEQSQIYRTLKSLEAQGLVESEEAPSKKGPKRRLYLRTAAGRAALLEWLGSAAEIGDSRIPYLARLFFLGQLEDLKASEVFLEEIRDHYAGLLEALQALDASWRADCTDFPNFDCDEEFHAYLVLAHGMAKTESVLHWAETAIEWIHARRTGSSSKEEKGRAS